jgi:hypothetical protein
VDEGVKVAECVSVNVEAVVIVHVYDGDEEGVTVGVSVFVCVIEVVHE